VRWWWTSDNYPNSPLHLRDRDTVMILTLFLGLCIGVLGIFIYAEVQKRAMNRLENRVKEKVTNIKIERREVPDRRLSFRGGPTNPNGTTKTGRRNSDRVMRRRK